MGFMDKMKGMQQQAQDAMGNTGGMSGAMGGGDMAAQAQVLCLIDHAHATGAELFQNPVMRDGLADHFKTQA